MNKKDTKVAQRVYSKDMEFDSDLFKLEVDNMLKNQGYDDTKPILTTIEHCHFFRTINSSGKKQENCNFVGGHVHKMSFEIDKNGNLIASASPAIGAKFNDKHTHKVTYLRSDRIQKRKLNKEAQEEIARHGKPA